MPTYTNIIKKLSSDVPFVGPETQERKLILVILSLIDIRTHNG